MLLVESKAIPTTSTKYLQDMLQQGAYYQIFKGLTMSLLKDCRNPPVKASLLLNPPVKASLLQQGNHPTQQNLSLMEKKSEKIESKPTTTTMTNLPSILHSEPPTLSWFAQMASYGHSRNWSQMYFSSDALRQSSANEQQMLNMIPNNPTTLVVGWYLVELLELLDPDLGNGRVAKMNDSAQKLWVQQFQTLTFRHDTQHRPNVALRLHRQRTNHLWSICWRSTMLLPPNRYLVMPQDAMEKLVVQAKIRVDALMACQEMELAFGMLTNMFAYELPLTCTVASINWTIVQWYIDRFYQSHNSWTVAVVYFYLWKLYQEALSDSLPLASLETSLTISNVFATMLPRLPPLFQWTSHQIVIWIRFFAPTSIALELENKTILPSSQQPSKWIDLTWSQLEALCTSVPDPVTKVALLAPQHETLHNILYSNLNSITPPCFLILLMHVCPLARQMTSDQKLRWGRNYCIDWLTHCYPLAKASPPLLPMASTTASNGASASAKTAANFIATRKPNAVVSSTLAFNASATAPVNATATAATANVTAIVPSTGTATTTIESVINTTNGAVVAPRSNPVPTFSHLYLMPSPSLSSLTNTNLAPTTPLPLLNKPSTLSNRWVARPQASSPLDVSSVSSVSSSSLVSSKNSSCCFS